MNHRNNEDPKLWFRTDRIFRVNGYWFFHTRENIDVGPYGTEFEAAIESDLLKNVLRDTPLIHACQVIRQFLFDSESLAEDGMHLSNDAYTEYVVRESATNLTLKTLMEGAE